jgi:hypothetical protein
MADAREGAGAANEATALSLAEPLAEAEGTSAVVPERLQPSGANDATAVGTSARDKTKAVRTKFTGCSLAKEPVGFASNRGGTPARPRFGFLGFGGAPEYHATLHGGLPFRRLLRRRALPYRRSPR